jgi:ribosomal protein L35AE/L33A
MAYDGGRVETRLSFTEKQIQEALIKHYGLPDDAKASFVVEKAYDYHERETGHSVVVQITYKQAIKPIGD